MPHCVFVFGTLKEGFPNFHVNQGVRVPGTFQTTERYPLYLVGKRHSPWLIHQPGHGEYVRGQVFEVDPAGLAAMDTLERITAPDGYRRVTVEVSPVDMPGSASRPAFAYLKQAQHFDPAEARMGPLAEFTLAHATRYQPRVPGVAPGAGESGA